MTSLSAEALRELKGLAEKAAPGPWEWEGRTVDDDGYVRIPECSYLVGCICLADTYEGYQKDCDYIAAASPDVILALLAERERLLKDAARYQWLRRDKTATEERQVIEIVRDNCEEYFDAEIDAAIVAAGEG